MVCGLWFVVCGLWFVVCGLWKIKNLVPFVKDKMIYPKKKIPQNKTIL
jgi:hypothetical protein